MSRDRYVWMDIVPDMQVVAMDVQEYLGDLASIEFADGSCIFSFPGEFTKHGEKRPRWVEIFTGVNSITVKTREMDGPTNDIADGIARLLGRKYKGKVDAGELQPEIPERKKT